MILSTPDSGEARHEADRENLFVKGVDAPQRGRLKANCLGFSSTAENSLLKQES